MAFEKKKTSFFIALLFLLTAFVGMQTSVVASGESPVADAGGPYVGEECNPVLLNASGSYDLEGDLLSYRWNIGGSWIENGNYPFMEWTWCDDYSGDIILEVSDGTTIVSDITTVTISNVPPHIVSIEGSTEVDENAEFTLNVIFFDGLADPRSPTASLDSFLMTFSWGDETSTELPLGSGEFSASSSHIYEEAGIYQIIVLVVDSNGGEARADWAVNVGEITLVEAGPDGIVAEGSPFLSSGYLADSDSPSYTAMVDYYDDSGAFALLLNSENTFDLSHTYLDDGVYTILVMVFNDGMEYGEDTAVVTVTNVPPSFDAFSLSPTSPVRPGDRIDVAGKFSDPGVLDIHTVTIDWGDGSSTTSSLEAGITDVSGSHSYGKAGDYQIVVVVTDDDGGSCQASMSVVVKNPSTSMDAIKGLIAGLKIPQHWKNSLLSILRNVPHFMNHHRMNAVIHQLQAFIHFVEAQSGRHLPRDQARELIRTTRMIIDTLRAM